MKNVFFYSTYQRICLQLSESFDLQQNDHSLPVTPLPDLTTLPREPIHQLKGKLLPGLCSFCHDLLVFVLMLNCGLTSCSLNIYLGLWCFCCLVPVLLCFYVRFFLFCFFNADFLFHSFVLLCKSFFFLFSCIFLSGCLFSVQDSLVSCLVLLNVSSSSFFIYFHSRKSCLHLFTVFFLLTNFYSDNHPSQYLHSLDFLAIIQILFDLLELFLQPQFWQKLGCSVNKNRL